MHTYIFSYVEYAKTIITLRKVNFNRLGSDIENSLDVCLSMMIAKVNLSAYTNNCPNILIKLVDDPLL